MADDKYKFYTTAAESTLDNLHVEHPELAQAQMIQGVGYALLAVAHELRVIEQGMDMVRPTKEKD